MSRPDIAGAAFPLRSLYFFLSSGCNLHCRHCWIAPPFQEAPSFRGAVEFDLFAHIIREAKPLGLQAVKLTGGEPLLHPRFPDLLELLRAENLGLMLETNATLMTPAIARLLAGFPQVLVSVSLDSPDPEVHEWVRGRERCFDEALRGMKCLADAGAPFQIIMTLMRRNRDQIERMIPFARRQGANLVKFNLIQPLSRGGELYDAGEALKVSELVELGRWVESDLSQRAELPLYYDHPLAFQPLSRLIRQGDLDCRRCGILNILGVLPDGSWAMCGLAEELPELMFGRAGRDGLREVWEEAPKLRELRAGMHHRLEGICGACIHQGSCQGSCVVHNYTRTRNLWAPFWYCREADEAGLFPAARRKAPGPADILHQGSPAASLRQAQQE